MQKRLQKTLRHKEVNKIDWDYNIIRAWQTFIKNKIQNNINLINKNLTTNTLGQSIYVVRFNFTENTYFSMISAGFQLFYIFKWVIIHFIAQSYSSEVLFIVVCAEGGIDFVSSRAFTKSINHSLNLK